MIMVGFMFIKVLLLILHLSCVFGIFERKVHTEYLCPEQCSSQTLYGDHINVIHTTATGPSDVLHYLTSTIGYPAVFIAQTHPNATLQINWDSVLSKNLSSFVGSVSFSAEPEFVYGLQFIQLIEYNDLEDTANLSLIPANDTTLWRRYNLADTLSWENSSLLSNFSDNEIVLKTARAHDVSNVNNQIKFFENGSFSIKLHISGSEGRSEELPRLQHTSNSTQIGIIIDHVEPSFSNSRFAVEMILVTSDSPGVSTVQLHTHKSIDDEHTPGVFEVMDLTAESNTSSGAYIQWKPVCYKTKDRAMKTATRTKHYPPQGLNSIEHSVKDQRSILLAYFGDDLYLSGKYTLRALNISFGLSEDKFYTFGNYTSWTMTLGSGVVLEEEVSMLIIIIISVCLGIPVILMVAGSIGACVHKSKKNKQPENRSGYSVIN